MASTPFNAGSASSPFCSSTWPSTTSGSSIICVRLGVAPCFADLPQADLRALVDVGDVFDANGRAVHRCHHRVLDVLNGLKQALGLDVDLLRPGLDEAAAGVGVVQRKLVLDLGDA